MSYDISLVDPVTRETLEVDEPHMMSGGTYQVGGTTELWVNITYNYAKWYYKDYAFGDNGIRSIYNLTGAESIPVLKKAIDGLVNSDEELSTEDMERYASQGILDGYWLGSRKNAIKPLYQLLAMAKMRPDGIWEGD